MIYKGGLGIQIEPIYIHSGQVFIHKVWKLYFFYLHLVWFASDTEVQKFHRGGNPYCPVVPIPLVEYINHLVMYSCSFIQ